MTCAGALAQDFTAQPCFNQRNSKTSSSRPRTTANSDHREVQTMLPVCSFPMAMQRGTQARSVRAGHAEALPQGGLLPTRSFVADLRSVPIALVWALYVVSTFPPGVHHTRLGLFRVALVRATLSYSSHLTPVGCVGLPHEAIATLQVTMTSTKCLQYITCLRSSPSQFTNHNNCKPDVYSTRAIQVPNINPKTLYRLIRRWRRSRGRIRAIISLPHRVRIPKNCPHMAEQNSLQRHHQIVI